MKAKRFLILTVFVLIFGSPVTVTAHTVNYAIQQKGIAVKFFYAADDPTSYSEFEIFGPGDKLPYQTGRTDKNGFVAFVPDRQGIWKVKVLGESSHGFHGIATEVKVDKDFNLESFKKPLAATYNKLVTGVSLIIGLFGIYAFFRSRKKK